MIYRHLEIEYIGDELYTIKNRVTRRYVKMGGRETKYLLSHIGYEGDELSFPEQEELNVEEREFMLEKFEEWGFLNEDEVVEEKKDITKIKLWEINPERCLGRIPRWIRELFLLSSKLNDA